MVIVKLENPKTGEKKEIYLDGWLKQQLDSKIKPAITKMSEDYVLIIDGRERCLSKDTLIKHTKGIDKISNLSNKTILLDSFDFKKNKKITSKGRVFNTGKQIVHEIETEDGRKIKATSKHTFFVLRNTKVIELRLEELKEGDELICK